jgi:ATP-dependent DNA ligase
MESKSGRGIRDWRIQRLPGSRTEFGALLLSACKGVELHYIGKIATGFTRKTLASLREAFARILKAPALCRPAP